MKIEINFSKLERFKNIKKLIKILEKRIEAIALNIFEIENIEDLNKYGL